MSDHPATGSSAVSSVVEWFAAQPAGLNPEVITDAAADAAIVGIGVSTRESREVFEFVEHTTHVLIGSGFSTIALWENPRVTDLYDRYITGGDVGVDDALSQAWGPWQTVEMRQALIGLRDLNIGRETPVRIIGVGQARVLTQDYDRAVQLLDGIDPATAAEVKERLDVIRIAHTHGEHVLRAHGGHPGTPFAELARAARAAAAELEPSQARDDALGILDGIVDFHTHPMAPGADMSEASREAAGHLVDHQRDTGERIVFWEGIAHVAAHPGPMLGAHLRQALDQRYVTVLVTFDHGRITLMDVPPPRPDSLEAAIAEAGGARVVALHAAQAADIADELDRAWSTRLISGVYRAENDHDHYTELPSLSGSFDVVTFIPTVTTVHALGAANDEDGTEFLNLRGAKEN